MLFAQHFEKITLVTSADRMLVFRTLWNTSWTVHSNIPRMTCAISPKGSHDRVDMILLDRVLLVLNDLTNFENVLVTVRLGTTSRNLTDDQAMALVVFLYGFAKKALRDSLGPGVWLKDVGETSTTSDFALSKIGAAVSRIGFNPAQMVGGSSRSGWSWSCSY